LTKTETWIVLASTWMFGAVLALDRLTSASYQTIATNSFDSHSLLTLVSVTRSISAVSALPVFAQVYELIGREWAYASGLVIYIAGNTLMAVSQNIAQYGAGACLHEVGANGLFVSQLLLIAALSSSRNRLFFQVLPQTAFFVLGFPSAKIYNAVLAGPGWRFGISTFSFLVPVALLPLLVSLFLARRRHARAQRFGVSTDVPVQHTSRSVAVQLWINADLVGLLLLVITLSLLLVPLVLATRLQASFSSAKVLAPLLVGALVGLPCFLAWERFGARRPAIPLELVASRAVFFSAAASMLFWCGWTVCTTYLPTILYVVMDTSDTEQQYISAIFNTTTAAMQVVVVAPTVRWIRRLYPFQISGIILALVSTIMLTAFTTANDKVRIAMAMLVAGVGDAMFAPATLVSIQVTVPDRHLASATASWSIMFFIGSAVGSAIAGATWSELVQNKLESLSQFSASEQAQVYAEPLTWIENNSAGSIIRAAVIGSVYSPTQRVLAIIGSVIMGVAVLIALFCPHPVLSD
ncbi:MFS general substrate transporter, partial [Testicularia cyperi]